MPTRARRYLYIRESLAISIPESELGSGKTLTANICATSSGNPSAISSCTGSATASGSAYSITIARSLLQSALGTTYLNKSVWLHLDDGAAWHDTWEFVVTDVDPDLLAVLT